MRKGVTMVAGKSFITAMIVLAMFVGCSKKKPVKDTEFTSSAKTATSTPAAASTQDIFDEFYKEDSDTSKTATKAQKSQPVMRSSAAEPPVFSERGRFAVQVSTLPSRSLADALSEKLRAKGYPSYVAEVSNPTPSLSGTYYRVRIGGFTGVSLARSFAEKFLVPEGYDFWVDNRSNDNIGINGAGMGAGSGSNYYETSTTPSYQSSYQPSYQSAYEPGYQTEPLTQSPDASEKPQKETTTPAQPTPEASPSSSKGTSTQSEWGSSDDW